MQFYRQHCPRMYGKLMRDADFDKTKGSDVRHHPSIGLLILEIQQGIYNFLLSSAKLILHDINCVQYFLAPNQCTPSVPAPKTEEWPSLTRHMLEQPY